MCTVSEVRSCTLPKTDIALKINGLENEMSFKIDYFQGLYVSFRDGKSPNKTQAFGRSELATSQVSASHPVVLS